MQSGTMVKCLLQMDTVTRKAWVRVLVQSQMKPKVWGAANVDADSTNLEYRVQAAAEQIANYQAETYFDIHNPGAVGRAAVAALREIQETARKAAQKLV